MSFVIGVVNQKGGVGKSTIARLVAREYAAAGWSVMIADLDSGQGTTVDWGARRRHYQVEPEIFVSQYERPQDAVKHAGAFDLLVFDGRPHADKTTEQVAGLSDMVVIPSGLAMDDLKPSRALALELVRKGGIAKERVWIVLNARGDSDSELVEAEAYIRQEGVNLLPGCMPHKTGYRRSSDLGRALTETPYPSLRERAIEVAQGIADRFGKLTNPDEVVIATGDASHTENPLNKLQERA